MFGWDWGPQIPDSGIFRNISIQGYKYGRLDDVYITQQHNGKEVLLDVRVGHTRWNIKRVTVEVVVTAPNGETAVSRVDTSNSTEHILLSIANPELWWPNGYGAQPLYQVKVSLKKDNDLLDLWKCNIGLRTIKVRREKDEWGESFEFNVNGVSIFAMGADYIPEDSLLPRCNPERTERLIKDCVEANFNCIRVWGGGYYPDDYFFDLCDKYGLIVWQDLMFACAVYEMTDEFAEKH
jgi:domain.